MIMKDDSMNHPWKQRLIDIEIDFVLLTVFLAR